MKKIKSFLLILIALSISITSAYAASAPIGYMYEGGSKRLLPDSAKYASVQWAVSDPAVLSVQKGLVSALSAGRSVVSATWNGVTKRAGVVVLPKRVTLKSGEKLQLPTVAGTKWTSSKKSVATVSNGSVTAISAGAAILTAKYKKQTMKVEITVTGTTVKQSKAAELSCASTADQIVLVEYSSGSNATLSLHEKKNGIWTELASCKAYVGKNGIGKTKEGDKKTPTGTYNLNQPFGIKADPGAKLPYTQVTTYHYWCGSSSSGYYNRMVDSRVTGRKYTSSDEHLIDYKGYYNYCMFIDYNAAGVAGKGSCIFLHCTGGKSYTAGCIAIEESMMKRVVQWAGTNCKIVIR